jgi:hypothetical protein
LLTPRSGWQRRHLHALETNTSLDRAELLKQHPDLAEDLQSFFRNRDVMQRVADPIREQLPDLAETGSKSCKVGPVPTGRCPGHLETAPRN